jgi:hypothetical protein
VNDGDKHRHVVILFNKLKANQARAEARAWKKNIIIHSTLIANNDNMAGS